jgi:hypothetical protein
MMVQEYETDAELDLSCIDDLMHGDHIIMEIEA